MVGARDDGAALRRPSAPSTAAATASPPPADVAVISLPSFGARFRRVKSGQNGRVR